MKKGNENWASANCDGSGPCAGKEVRRLSTGADGAVILCRNCYEHEIKWRKTRIKEGVMFDLPAWNALELYSYSKEVTP